MSFACRINVLKPKLNSHVQTSAVRYVLYLKLKKKLASRNSIISMTIIYYKLIRIEYAIQTFPPL